MEFVFGTLSDGREVRAYTLTSGEENAVILDYGCILQSLAVKNAAGRLTDVVLGHDTAEEYETLSGRLGAVMGRCVNRIAGGEITVNGTVYPLSRNKGSVHAHGGFCGFDRKLWRAEQIAENKLRLTCVSPDGEEGYPGTLRAAVTYVFENHVLAIEYEAESDRDTVVNLTNHSYFNLDGGGSVLGHRLRVAASRYIPTDADSIPFGRFDPVEGTPLDFRTEKPLSCGADSDFEQIRQVGGYDIHLQFDKEPGAFGEVARLTGEDGIRMTVSTDRPGMQLFSANGIDQTGKGGVRYRPRCGICFETQLPPDPTHHPAFGDAVLRAGERFRSKTTFAFSADGGKGR